MPLFLIEAYLSREHPQELDAAARRLRRAAAAPSRPDQAVRYLRSVFVPADETCFHLVEAPDAAAARELAIHASISPDRVEAVDAADGGLHPGR